MQYRVAICDDMVFFIDEVKEYIEKYAKENEKQIEISVYLDGADLMVDVEKRRYDIVFLDVDMPVMNGIETAKRIRQFDQDLIIIFITSHDSFSFEAAQVEAMGYIVKPIDGEILQRIMKKAFLLVQGIQEEKQKERRYLEVSVDYEKKALDITKIVCMEKSRNQMIIHMEDGKEYICYETLKNMMTRLPRTIFFQISSSMIVNIMKVREVKSYVVTVEMNHEDREYSIARANYGKIRSEFLNFSKKKKGKKC